jgi:hypothetical protein
MQLEQTAICDFGFNEPVYDIETTVIEHQGHRKNREHNNRLLQISTTRLHEERQETIYWQPALEVGETGQARINFKLPNSLTRLLDKEMDLAKEHTEISEKSIR